MKQSIAGIGLQRLKNCITMDKSGMIPDKLLNLVCTELKKTLDNYFDIDEVSLDVMRGENGEIFLNLLGELKRVKSFSII